MNRKKTQRLYREESLSVRRRRGRKCATVTRAPLIVEASANARCSVDFVHDQFASGRRFRILNVIDDVIKEWSGPLGPDMCQAAVLTPSCWAWRSSNCAGLR